MQAARPKFRPRGALLFAALAATAGCALHEGQPEADMRWGYPAGSEPGAAAPVGCMQWPVALETYDARRGRTPDLGFRYHPAEIGADGRGAAASVAYPSGSFLTAGDQRYELAEIRFHARSVHTVDGMSYPAEAHLVHLDRYRRPAAIAAVLFREGAANPTVDEMLADPRARAVAPVPMESSPAGTFNATELLPDDRSYVAYQGSLPEAPCANDVTWFVMTQPIEATAEQLAVIAEMSGGDRPAPAASRPAAVVHRASATDERVGYHDEGE